jgi:hypothetical protein
MSKNEPPKFVCLNCDYHSNKKSNLKRHFKSKRHNDNKQGKNDNKNEPFFCDCGKSYKYLSGLSRHMVVCKRRQNGNKMVTNGNKMVTYRCFCGKEYKHRTALSRHKKTCMGVVNVNESQECFQTYLVDALKNVLPQMGNTIIHNAPVTRITNNQINVFLNEQCADAMSIQEFAENLSFTIDDLLLQRQESLTKVIHENLAPLGVKERPVHCTNSTRRKWVVKDKTTGWQKDDGQTLVRSVGFGINKKWAEAFADATPEWMTQPEKRDEYVRIISSTTSSLAPKAEARILTEVGDMFMIDSGVLATLGV